MNPVAESLTGWRQADGAGQPLEGVFRIVNEDSRETVENPVTKALRDGCIVGLANHTLLIAKDGMETAIDDCAAPIRFEGGAIAGAVLVFHGITERRNFERELGRQNARLIEADRRKDEFLAMLGHELRNPLAPLSTSLSVLRHVAGTNPLLEQSRTIMERQVKHLVRLVDDLLDVARITRGKIDLRRERVELNDLIDRAVEAVRAARRRAGARPLRLVPAQASSGWTPTPPASSSASSTCSTTPASTPRRAADPPDRPARRRRHRPLGAGQRRRHRAGHGRADFDLFAQAERSLGPVGGRGHRPDDGEEAGRDARRPGGGPERGSGQGERVIIWLPDATVERVAAVVPAGPPPESPPGRGCASWSWTTTRTRRRASPSCCGHTATRSSMSSTTATRRSKPSEPGPAVVLLDIGLPGMNGYEIAERVREEARPRPYLVAVTGYGLDSDKLKAREAGIDHHIVKPVHPDRLRELLVLIAEQWGWSGSG